MAHQQTLADHRAFVSHTHSLGIPFKTNRQSSRHTAFSPSTRSVRAQNLSRQLSCLASKEKHTHAKAAINTAEISTALWLLSQLPADAAETSVDFSKGSFSTQSYVVTLGLFLISLPGELCFLSSHL